MIGVVVAVGLMVLVGLSVAAGVLLAGERHHRRRVRLDARSWSLFGWEQDLLNAAEYRGCSACQLLRRRAELHRTPDGG